jgi:hypothetical protein
VSPEASPPEDRTTRNAAGVLPWVLLVTAVIVALSSAHPPSAGGAVASAAALPGAAAASPGRGEPQLDVMELRESRMHIGHEECEEGVKRINVLEGKPATDPGALHFIGSCLAHGNVAWYKCIVRAQNKDEARACNRRLLGPAVP